MDIDKFQYFCVKDWYKMQICIFIPQNYNSAYKGWRQFFMKIHTDGLVSKC